MEREREKKCVYLITIEFMIEFSRRRRRRRIAIILYLVVGCH